MNAIRVAAILAAAVAADGGRVADPRASQRDFPATWLEGTIGSHAVRVFVEAAGSPIGGPPPAELWGTYYYVSHHRGITLEGERTGSDTIKLYEGDPNSPRSTRAQFTLRLGTRVTGTWSNGATTLPVRLTRVKQPPSFADAVRRPRVFAAPEWPFTLTYPDGWFLDVTGETLVLRPIDPEDMMYDTTLECERGHGVPAPPRQGEAPTQSIAGMYRTHDGWLTSPMGIECDAEPQNCTPPGRRVVDGVEMLWTEILYRVYSPWSYAGAGDATEYVFIAGDDWVDCTDRLLDRPDRFRPRRPTAKR